jgi:hypothetical protein
MLEPFKTALSDFLHLSKDALHVHLGIAIYVLAALLARRSLGSAMPWLVLLAFELVNEGVDLTGDFVNGAFGFGSLLAAGKDIVNTMLWPTLLLIAVRLGWRGLERGGPVRDARR